MMKIELCGKDSSYSWCDDLDIKYVKSMDESFGKREEGKIIKLFKSFVGLFD